MSITGSGTDSVVGTGNDDILTGAPSGASTITDSGVADTFNVTSTADHVTDTGSGGVVNSTVTWTLGTNFTGLNLSGGGNINGTGNAAGGDSIVGNTGTDVLSDGGTTGADTLAGNSSGGTDTFVVKNAGDHVTESDTTPTTALIDSSVSWSLTANTTHVNNLTLTAGSLTGTANNGSDTLTALVGTDTLIGGTGNDTFIIGSTADHITAAGTGTIEIGASYSLASSNTDITLAGGTINNLILTGTGAFTGTANTGTDVLTSNSGKDTLVGGTGEDTFVVNNTGDTVTQTHSATGSIIESSVNFGLVTNVNTLVLEGGSTNLTATGNAAADTITGNSGADTFIVSTAGNDITGGSAASVIDSSISYTLGLNGSTVHNLTLTAGSLTGTADSGSDTITATAGTDTLVGGGAGSNDTFNIGTNVNDDISQSGIGGTGTIEAGASYSLASPDITVTSSGTINNLILTATGISGTANSGTDVLTGSTTGKDTLIGGTGQDTFVVNNTGDVITQTHSVAGSLVDLSVNFSLAGITGSTVNQLTLTGGTNLTATGNGNQDTLTGNAGTDTFIVGNSLDDITGGSAASVIDSSVSFTLGAHGTTVHNLTLTGSTALTGIGDASTDILTSNTGADTLTGESSGGTDTFFVGNTGDVVSEAGHVATTALINSSVSFDLNTQSEGATGVNHLTLTGSTALTATGNANTDILTSNTAADKLIGMSTAGSDTFIVHNATDTVTETNAATTALVESYTSFSLLNTGVNQLTLEGTTVGLTATGNAAGGDTIIGNSSANILSAGTGVLADTLTGESSGGTDTFIVNNTGDAVTEGAHSPGTTALIESSVSQTLASGLMLASGINNLTLTGSAALTATANTGADHLTANTGADTLTAGTGADTLTGGAGADVFVVNQAGDTLTQGAGKDTVETSLNSFSLATDTTISNLTLMGTAAGTATGNALANVITDSHTVTGVDTLYGGGGSDTFILGANASDHISESAAGTNAIEVAATFDLLTTGVADIARTGSATTANTTFNNLMLINTSLNDTATGNESNDILTANNTGGLDVLVGSSTVAGSTGGDTFVVDLAGDTVQETNAESAALVDSAVSFSLASGVTSGTVNHLTLTGTTAVTGTGNTGGGDTITGNTGNDTLSDDGGGADSITGNSTTGGDVFVVSNSGDTIDEVHSSAASLIKSSVNYTLGAHSTGVNDLTLTAAGISGVANTSTDVLTTYGTGGAGADTLVGHGSDTFVLNNTGDVISNSAGSATVEIGTGFTGETGNTFSLTTGTNANISAGGTDINNLNLSLTTGAFTATGDSAANVFTTSVTGTDSVAGGGGADTFIVNNTTDHVSESGAGASVVDSSVSFDLATNASYTGSATINTLTLTGNGTATANAAADHLTANTGSTDVLIDGAGNDTLTGGGAGSTDTFIISHTGDTITASAAATSNTIELSAADASASYTLTTASNIQNAIMQSNTADLIVTGDTGNNILGATGTGADTLIGGGGNDTFIIGNTTDIVEQSASGTGTIETSVDYSLLSNADITLTTGGTVNNLTLIGGTLSAASDLTITGNNSTDILTDATIGTGYDTLIGNSASHGTDTFIINNATDVVSEAQTATSALVESSGNFSLANVIGGGSVNQLTLTGTGNDSGAGNSGGTDTIIGNSGNDTLSDNGGASADTMTGHSTVVGGGDTFIVSHATDTVTEDGVNTTALVESSAGFTLGATINQLTLTGAGDDLTATGNTSTDILTDATSGSGGDTLTGNSTHGTDTFVVNNSTDHVVETNTATTAIVDSSATFSLVGTGVNSLTLTAGAITGTANTAGDLITGSAAAGDVLVGAATGNDTLAGNSSTGADTFVVHNTVQADTTITEAHASSTLTAIDAYGNFSLVTQGTSFDVLTLMAGSITGTANTAGDLITGNAAGDVFVSASSGNDTLAGHGTAGADTFDVNYANDVITEAGSNAGSLVNSIVSYTLVTGVNHITLTGSGDDLTAAGNTSTDVLTDATSGSGGDTLLGNSTGGTDTFIVNSSTDVVSEAHDGTTALIDSNATFSLANVIGGGTVNQLTLTTAATDVTATGNTDNDTLIDGSTAGYNILSDGTGHGADSMVDNSTGGHDTFMVSNASDTVTATNGSADVVSTALSFSLLGTGVDNLVLTGTGLTGTANNDAAASITDNSTGGYNILVSGTGTDALADNSTDGHDTFMVNNALDAVTATHGSAEIIEATLGSGKLFSLQGTGVQQLELLGTGNDSGTAATTGTDTITGNGGDDVLSDNSTTTGAGNEDTLDGKSANGGDTFIVHNADDTINEATNIGGGADEIETSLSGTGFDSLSGSYASFYNLDYIGTTSGTSLVGNNLANTITDNSTGGSNILNDGGIGGNDTLTDNSTAGGDTFIVNNAGDQVAATNGSADVIEATLFTAQAFSLAGTGVHKLELLGTGNDSGTADTSGNDTIVGNNGNDVLTDAGGATGAGNADTLEGYSTVVGGGDTFMVNNALDTVSENSSESAALIESTVSFGLVSHVNTLTLLGTTAVTGTGNGAADTITGNTAAAGDVLSAGSAGGAGDTLTGNSSDGHDTFVTYNAGDVITETDVSSSTLIESYVSSFSLATQGTGFDKLTLMAGGLSGTANSDANNTIIGSTLGADTLISNVTGTGTDVLTGNHGNDVFEIYSASEFSNISEASALNGGATVDFYSTANGVNLTLGTNMTTLNLNFNANTGNDSGTGNSTGGDTIIGNAGNDVLSDNNGTVADTLEGNSAYGHDTFIVHNTGDSVVENGGGTGSVVEAYGTFSLANVTGSAGGGTGDPAVNHLTLEGATGGLTGTANNVIADTITDNTSVGGNTLVSGTAFVDTLIANSSAANDTFIVNNAGDTITESDSSSTTATVEFDAGGNAVTYTVGTNINAVIMSGTGSDSITGNSAGGDTITASSGTGAETITDGTGGADVMYAGSASGADDTFILNSANDTVIGSNTGDTADLIKLTLAGSDSFSLATNSTDIDNLIVAGAGGDSVSGNLDNDTITATSDSNTLGDGGSYNSGTHVVTAGGVDSITGAGGFDTFLLHNAADVIKEADVGVYIVDSWASFNLATNATTVGNTNIANLTLEGTANLTGTALTTGHGVIDGNSGNDILYDSTSSLAANSDTLIGNSTNSSVGGGDTFIVSNTADIVEELAGGLGTVESTVNYTLGAHVKNLILETGATAGTGDSVISNADNIVGNTGSDTLSDGGNDTSASVVGLNADTLTGHSSGTDTFMVYNSGDIVTEDGTSTTSIIDSYATLSLVGTNVNTLNLEGNGAVLTVTGNAGADSIIDTTTGTGANVLISGTGADSLTDNSTVGDDTFVVNNTADVIKEEGPGVAVIESSVTFDLVSGSGHFTGVANTLILEGSNNITATANATAGNVLNAAATTGTAHDILNDGAGGSDVFTASTTSTVHVTFVVDHASDSISGDISSADTIQTNLTSGAFLSLTGSYANMGSLIMMAADASGTAGTTESNSISGQGGSDTLTDSGATTYADTLAGTDGGDLFNVANTNDHVTESGASATVDATVSFTLGANMNVLNLTGTGLTGTGYGSGAETLTSTSGSDTLISGTGADSLSGAGTADVFEVYNGSDTVAESGSGGTVDYYGGPGSFTLVVNTTVLNLEGDGNETGVAYTSGNDTINGNFGDDVLTSNASGTDSLVGNSVDGGDTFNVNNAGDHISEETAVVGAAVVNADHSFNLGSDVSAGTIDTLNLTGTGLLGTANDLASNTLTSDGNNDTLTDSGTYADTLSGDGTGDVFNVSNIHDVVSEAGSGATVNSSVTFALGTNMSILDLTASGITGTGNGAADHISNTSGGVDTIVGSTAGEDTLTGNGGADVFDVNDAATLSADVTETNGAGGATVNYAAASGGFTLGANMNHLTLTGSGLTGTGNTTAADTLSDLSGGNTLVSGTASTHNDTLIGGNDTMTGETGGSGVDTFELSAATAYSGVATINHFVGGSSVLDISHIISGAAAGGAGGSDVVEVATDGSGGTLVYVDYGGAAENPSYPFVEVADLKSTGGTLTIGELDLHL